MEISSKSIEMVEVNIVDEENVTLNDNRSSNSPNNQSFNNDDTNLSKTTNKEKFTKSAKIPLEDEFGSIIFSIIVPCILVGGPFNFCFSKTYHNVHKLMNTKCLKVCLELFFICYVYYSNIKINQTFGTSIVDLYILFIHIGPYYPRLLDCKIVHLNVYIETSYRRCN